MVEKLAEKEVLESLYCLDKQFISHKRKIGMLSTIRWKDYPSKLTKSILKEIYEMITDVFERFSVKTKFVISWEIIA